MASEMPCVRSVLSSAVATGKPVDEQDEVDALLVVERVVQLPDDGQTVLLVELDQRRILVVRRLELAQAELGVHVLEAVPQQVQRAVGVQLLCHPLDEHRLRLAVMPLLELGPFGRLGLLYISKQVLGKDGLGPVVGRGILQMREHAPARGGHLGAELVFEDFFGVYVGQCWHGSIQKASKELRKEAGVLLTLVAHRFVSDCLPEGNSRAQEQCCDASPLGDANESGVENFVEHLSHGGGCRPRQLGFVVFQPGLQSRRNQEVEDDKSDDAGNQGTLGAELVGNGTHVAHCRTQVAT